MFNGGGLYIDRVGDFAKKKPLGTVTATKNRGEILPCTLLISGLPPKFGDRKRLRSLFPKCKAVDVPKFHEGGRSVTHGTVKFATMGEAREAFEAAKDLTVDGKKVTVVYAQKKVKKKTNEVEMNEKEDDDESDGEEGADDDESDGEEGEDVEIKDEEVSQKTVY